MKEWIKPFCELNFSALKNICLGESNIEIINATTLTWQGHMAWWAHYLSFCCHINVVTLIISTLDSDKHLFFNVP